MADIPRRLPPTPDERLRIVATRMAGGGDLGSTRWAQPVTKTSNYSPVNAPADDTPDVGTYTFAVAYTGEAVTNTGDPADDANYVVSFTLDTGMKPGSVYLIETRSPVAFSPFSYYPPGFMDPDGVQAWIDGATSFVVVDSTSPQPSRGFYPQDDPASYPVFVPPYDDGSITDQPNFPRMTLTLTATAQFAADVAAPAVTLNIRSVGPSVKSLLGTHFIRATYIGPLTISS